MRIYKKSDIEISTVVLIIILLCFLVAFAIFIWQSEGPMSVYLDKIFNWV